jgi:hypothetical protein
MMVTGDQEHRSDRVNGKTKRNKKPNRNKENQKQKLPKPIGAEKNPGSFGIEVHLW